MSEGRIIKKKISTSERVNALPGDGALLFMFLIPHLDRDGRIKGSAKYIKNQIIPLRPCNVNQVDKWLDLMAQSKDPVTGEGLIERYEVNGIQYLWMPGFQGEQGQARHGEDFPAWYKREAPSEIPPPPNQPNTIPPQPKTELPKELDPDIKKAVEIHEQELGKMVTPMGLEKLKDMVEHYGIDIFEQAVKEAVSSIKTGKPNLNYIEKVCESIKFKGSNGRQATPAHDGREIDFG
jgi:DnaD/phage-associated family protein